MCVGSGSCAGHPRRARGGGGGEVTSKTRKCEIVHLHQSSRSCGPASNSVRRGACAAVPRPSINTLRRARCRAAGSPTHVTPTRVALRCPLARDGLRNSELRRVTHVYETTLYRYGCTVGLQPTLHTKHRAWMHCLRGAHRDSTTPGGLDGCLHQGHVAYLARDIVTQAAREIHVRELE